MKCVVMCDGFVIVCRAFTQVEQLLRRRDVTFAEFLLENTTEHGMLVGCSRRLFLPPSLPSFHRSVLSPVVAKLDVW
jgi:hypothetical protein